MKNYKTTSRKQSSRLSLRNLLIGLAGLGLVVGTLALLDARNVIDLPLFRDTRTNTITDGVNYGPPTEQEKQETEDFKNNLSSGNSSTPAPSGTTSSKKAVTPVISASGYTGKAEVGSYVAGVIEDGGTCTLTLKKDGQTVKESRAATADAQTTSCGWITIDGSRLSAGSWTATITYESSTSQGTSQPVTIEVT